MIPHKSQQYMTVLVLSFSLHISRDEWVPSINSNSVKTALKGATDQLGHSLGCVINATAHVDPCKKWDIKDGFWRLDKL